MVNEMIWSVAWLMRKIHEIHSICLPVLRSMSGHGCLLRLVAFVGASGSDDLAYSIHAYRIATGTFHIEAFKDIAAFRMGLLLPVALLYKLFGPNEWTLVA